MDRITAAEVFVTIVDRGSMIAAAETLEMSRAMVTRYLAQMEQWAGARLLHRTTRKLSLTDAGERTLERCRQMLALAGRSTWWRKGRATSCAACCASPVRNRSGKRRWWGRSLSI